MKLKLILLSAITAMTANITSAQPVPTDSTSAEKTHEFSLKGEIMSRGEWRDGALPAAENDQAKIVLERTRLFLNYKQRHIEVQITPQHSGVWGTAGGGDFTLREAWAKIDTKGLFAKVGRQTLAYDDERVIGMDDWSMTSAYHDALKLGYEGHGHKFHAVLAYNQNNDNMNGGSLYFNGGQVYKSMQMLWYHYDFTPRLGASALFVNTGMQSMIENDNRTINQQLMGIYAKYAPRSLSLEGSFYYQSGHNEFNMPISAWMMSAEGNWNIDHHWKTNMGYFHLSGDENYYAVEPGNIGLALQTQADAFNLLFASHHQFYGAMEFFYLTAFYGGYSPGLQDFHLGTQYSPTPNVTLGAKYHWLGTSIKVPDMNKSIGHELELSASWQIYKDITLSAGYSFMQGSDTLKLLKRTNEDNQLQWGWIMLVISPRFFSTKW